MHTGAAFPAAIITAAFFAAGATLSAVLRLRHGSKPTTGRSSESPGRRRMAGLDAKVAALTADEAALHRLPFPDAQRLFSLSKWGFVSSNPLTRLPPRFEAWERSIDHLPARLCAGVARSHIEALPILDASSLTSDAELRRALQVLSTLANAYVWCDTPPATVLPPCVAVPLLSVAADLDMPPILTHGSLVLNNFSLLDPTRPPVMDNVKMLVQFLGGKDEFVFSMLTLELEVAGSACLPHLWAAQSHAFEFTSGHHAALDDVAASLHGVAAGVRKMTATMSRMREGCEPVCFYHRIRPFLSGWKNNPTLPDGLVYAGTNGNQSLQYFGGSAAQSSLVPALDALGVSHDHPASSGFLGAMRGYMPHPHRKFLEVLEARCNVRAALSSVAASHPASAAFNSVVSALAAFRAVHLSIVRDYILAPQAAAQAKAGIHDAAGGKGTGGTSVVDFLEPLRVDTKAAALRA